MKKKISLEMIIAIVGMAFGIVILVLGFDSLGRGSYAEYASFGADFYTYSYKASRYAANNLTVVNDTIAKLIIAFGMFDLAYFGCKFAALFGKKSNAAAACSEAPAASSTPVAPVVPEAPAAPVVPAEPVMPVEAEQPVEEKKPEIDYDSLPEI